MGGDQQAKRSGDNILPKIWQTILIVTFIMGLGVTWAQLNGRVESLEKDYTKHCMEMKERLAKVPDNKVVELQFKHIIEALDDIHAELTSCRGTDEKFQQTLQQILFKLK